MSLNVLVLESDRGASDIVADELTAAGHQVLHCHDRDAPSFPCHGVENPSACPLRAHSVDVALTVRPRLHSRPTAGEDGVRCALMHRLPLVVAGSPILDPFAGYETRVVHRDDDVVRACEE